MGNCVLSVSAGRMSLFHQLLNFGIPHGEIGTLQWKNDSFAFTNSSTFNPQDPLKFVRGALKRDRDQRAESVDVQFTLLFKHGHDGFALDQPIEKKFHWQVNYFYETNIWKPFLPDRFVTYLVEEGKPNRQISETKILKLQVFEGTRDVTLFQPTPLLSDADLFDTTRNMRNSNAGKLLQKALMGTKLGMDLFPLAGSKGGTIILQGTNSIFVENIYHETNPFPAVINRPVVSNSVPPRAP